MPFGSVNSLARACSFLMVFGTEAQEALAGSAGSPGLTGRLGCPAVLLFSSPAVQVGSLLTGSLASSPAARVSASLPALTPSTPLSLSAAMPLGSLPLGAAGRVTGVWGAFAACVLISCLILALADSSLSPFGRFGRLGGTEGAAGTAGAVTAGAAFRAPAAASLAACALGAGLRLPTVA